MRRFLPSPGTLLFGAACLASLGLPAWAFREAWFDRMASGSGDAADTEACVEYLERRASGPGDPVTSLWAAAYLRLLLGLGGQAPVVQGPPPSETDLLRQVPPEVVEAVLRDYERLQAASPGDPGFEQAVQALRARLAAGASGILCP